jgi:hypothetical protein
MKIKTFGIAGIFFMLLGAAALIHPRILMPAKTDISKTGNNQQIIVETRRIVHVPRIVGVIWLLAGGGLVYLSTFEAPKNPRRRL